MIHQEFLFPFLDLRTKSMELAVILNHHLGNALRKVQAGCVFPRIHQIQMQKRMVNHTLKVFLVGW